MSQKILFCAIVPPIPDLHRFGNISNLLNINLYISDREKNEIQPLLCAADRDGAVHGRRSSALCSASPTLPWIDMDNTDHAYLPTVGRWGCEWPS